MPRSTRRRVCDAALLSSARSSKDAPASRRLHFRYCSSMSSINAGEAWARLALWRTLGADPAAHRQRNLITYDSRVVLAAAAKGCAHGAALLREFWLTYSYLLASDCAEGSQDGQRAQHGRQRLARRFAASAGAAQVFFFFF